MNSELSNIKCFIIHLQRAKKRKKFVEDIVNKVPIISEIIYAVDGSSLSEKKINSIYSNKKIYNPKYPFKLTSGEIGCFLSHREAWRRIVDQKLEAGLIIEDDVRINPSIFNKSLNFTLKNIQKYVTRFVQLRKIASVFDENLNVKGFKMVGENDNPLSEYLQTLQNNLYWILVNSNNL